MVCSCIESMFNLCKGHNKIFIFPARLAHFWNCSSYSDHFRMQMVWATAVTVMAAFCVFPGSPRRSAHQDPSRNLQPHVSPHQDLHERGGGQTAALRHGHPYPREDEAEQLGQRPPQIESRVNHRKHSSSKNFKSTIEGSPETLRLSIIFSGKTRVVVVFRWLM